MSADLEKLLEFMRFSHEVRNIQRAVLLETTDRHENDAEHQYQMALIALFIIDENDLKLDKYKCMALGIAHDVIEVYAGDVTVFAPQKDLEAKLLREKEAVNQIKKKWPSNHTLHELIQEYEECQTPEAKFVYALDKLLPEINNYLYEGKVWKEHGITRDQVKAIKKGKIEVDDTINSYHKGMLKIFDKHPELFGKPNQ